MRISSKADYAVRATAELAAFEGMGPVSELRHAGVVRSHRGADGGYELARPAAGITLADVIRAVEGPLANVHESRPEEIRYQGAAEPLREVWVAVRANLRAVLESVTVADLANRRLPRSVKAITSGRDAWRPH